METYSAKPGEVEEKWHLIDAADQTLGRLASLIANILRGKNKPQYTPHLDMGDFVVIINADKIKVTGKKETDKMYYHHTGYPGGFRSINFRDLMAKDPAKVIRRAVFGMLPTNKLRRVQIKKLKIYSGSEHPHQAQQPVEYKGGIN